jgi:hypothetical protein
MATQYTAGLTSGQVLTAAIMNQIGAAWVNYTPTLTQGVTVSKTIGLARYCQIQKLVIVNMDLTVTSAGTGATGIAFGLPLAAGAGTTQQIGTGMVYDQNINALYSGPLSLASTTTVTMLYQTGSPVGQSPSFALASGDVIRLMVAYEVA